MPQITEQEELWWTAPVARPVVAVIGLSALICMAIVVYACVEAADIEFRASVASAKKSDYRLPPIVAWYPKAYERGWLGPSLGTLGLAFLLCRKARSVGLLTVYVSCVSIFTTAWFAATLLVLYVLRTPMWA
jgi:hypothetical protein